MEVVRVRFLEGLVGGILFALGHAGLQRLRGLRVDGVLAGLGGLLFALVWIGLDLWKGGQGPGWPTREGRFRRGPRPGAPGARFDKFTEGARRVLSGAQAEAQRLNHNWIGTEHLLLGLIREGEGIAAQALADLGVDLGRARSAVSSIVGPGERLVTGEVGLTPRAKKAIELAVAEANRRGHHWIGTEHLLLGLLVEGEGVAVGVLESLGASRQRVREAVERRMPRAER